MKEFNIFVRATLYIEAGSEDEAEAKALACINDLPAVIESDCTVVDEIIRDDTGRRVT